MSAESVSGNPVLKVARWLRHHSDCELAQRESPLCTCGLNAAIAEVCPEIIAKATQRREAPCPTD